MGFGQLFLRFVPDVDQTDGQYDDHDAQKNVANLSILHDEILSVEIEGANKGQIRPIAKKKNKPLSNCRRLIAASRSRNEWIPGHSLTFPATTLTFIQPLKHAGSLHHSNHSDAGAQR